MSSYAEPTPGLKILGMPRPLAGALIGILLFLLIMLPLKLWGNNSLFLLFLQLDMDLLGRIVIALTNLDLPEKIAEILSVVISAIPPGILGWLIGSTKRSTRITGMVLAAIYLCILLVVGTLLTLMAI